MKFNGKRLLRIGRRIGRRILLLTIVLCAFGHVVMSQRSNLRDVETYEWEKIVPLVTTRGQVEEYFGKPILENPLITATYVTKLGKITVWYQGAEEPDGWECKWNVSIDTVNSYWVSLPGGLTVAKFRRDLKDFSRKETHLGHVAYTSLQKGISFVAVPRKDGQEEISSIQYSPTIEQIKCHCRQTLR